jgi:diguanylate cyclase (GGDEF)-like protein
MLHGPAETSSGFVPVKQRREPVHPASDILKPQARLEFERQFLWLRLSFAPTSLLLLLSYGWSSRFHALVIALAVMADCAVVWLLLLRWPRQVLRFQLVLRLLDVGVAYIVLQDVHRFVGNAYYDSVYLFLVVAATATHGKRGTYELTVVATLAVLLGRLELIWAGVLHFHVLQITDSLFYGLLFLTTGSITDFLMKKSGDALRHQAFHDALTNLPNRALLQDRLAQAVLLSRRNDTSMALLLMDLDRFKDVNDTFGHRYGDLLLQEVAERLRGTLRDSDTIARLGGDEFAVVLPEADAAEAVIVARKIQRALGDPFAIDELVLALGASVGITLFPKHGDDADTLLQRADVAMYVAKRTETGFGVYAAEQDEYSPDRLALTADLRRIIETDGLLLHYQPIVNLKTGQVESVEALARWEHAQRGFIPPDRFIPLAEHAGLMKPLTLAILTRALRQCAAWRSAGLVMNVTVNLSAQNLLDPELVETVAGLLRTYRARPDWLQVELTESVVMSDAERAREVLSRLHDLGIRIAIDDFGTGYSSLAYLKRLPVDEIKIDKSFVLEMTANDEDEHIVRAVADLGHSLEMGVVAEGVEDEHCLRLLTLIGCDRAQGYYLGRPLPAAELMSWLRYSSLGIARFAEPLQIEPAREIS